MKLNFIHQGKGSPVILLHGLFGSLRNLSQVGNALAEHFSVYLLDLRNHGDSPHHTQMRFADMAADVIHFMDRQQLSKAHLLGHSMGGKVAMQLALNAPQRVDRLVIADIAPVAYGRRHDAILKGLTAVEQDQPSSRREADRILAAYVEEQVLRNFLLKSLHRDKSGRYRLKFNLQAIIENYEEIMRPPEGTPFTGQTLFIKGSESPYLQAQYRTLTLQRFPHAQVKVIAGAGHWLHAEKPALFNRLVLNFLQGTNQPNEKQKRLDRD